MREKFIFDAFVDLYPVERFDNGSDMSGFMSLNNSTSKKVLNLLEPVKLTVWKVMIERVTVVKFRANYGGGNGAGCFEIKVWADTAKFTDVIVARLRKCGDLIREGKVFVKCIQASMSRVSVSHILREAWRLQRQLALR